MEASRTNMQLVRIRERRDYFNVLRRLDGVFKVSLQVWPGRSHVRFLSNHFPAVFSPQKGHALRSFEADGRFKVSVFSSLL